MRLAKRQSSAILEGDATPMIDMVFQLICFFMVALNFNEADQNERIQLPTSELARPPEGALEYPITLHLTTENTVIIGGDEVSLTQLRPYLIREKGGLQVQGKTLDDATIIIRADGKQQIGRVQELIRFCQDQGFEKFVMRAQEESAY